MPLNPSEAEGKMPHGPMFKKAMANLVPKETWKEDKLVALSTPPPPHHLEKQAGDLLPQARANKHPANA